MQASAAMENLTLPQADDYVWVPGSNASGLTTAPTAELVAQMAAAIVNPSIGNTDTEGWFGGTGQGYNATSTYGSDVTINSPFHAALLRGDRCYERRVGQQKMALCRHRSSDRCGIFLVLPRILLRYAHHGRRSWRRVDADPRLGDRSCVCRRSYGADPASRTPIGA